MIKIFENLLPVSLQNRIEQTVNDDMFPWFFMDNIKTQREYSAEVLQDMPKWDMSKVVDSFGLVHLVCFRDQANSPHFDMFRSVLYLLEKQEGFEIDSILRVRIRRTVKTEGSDDSTYNTPHVDMLHEKPFLTFVYYIEESDGDTLFFDRCFEKGSNDAEKAEPKILQRVKYKKGNGVLFDGHRFHAGNSPTNYLKRTVVNYDFTIKD
jgi:hypothetical protein